MKKALITRPFILCLLCLILLWGFVQHNFTARASTLLFFSPTRITLDENNHAQILKIKNLSDQPLHYKIHLRDYVMDENGRTENVDHFKYSAKRYIRYAPKTLSLAPGERKSVRMMLHNASQLQDGAYHTHMFFEEVVQRDTGQNTDTEITEISEMQYVAALPITIHHGQVTSEVKITAARLETAPKPPHRRKLHLTLSRTGNGQGYAVIQNTYIAKDGTETALSKDIKRRIYRETDQLNTI